MPLAFVLLFPSGNVFRAGDNGLSVPCFQPMPRTCVEHVVKAKRLQARHHLTSAYSARSQAQLLAYGNTHCRSCLNYHHLS